MYKTRWSVVLSVVFLFLFTPLVSATVTRSFLESIGSHDGGLDVEMSFAYETRGHIPLSRTNAWLQRQVATRILQFGFQDALGVMADNPMDRHITSMGPERLHSSSPLAMSSIGELPVTQMWFEPYEQNEGEEGSGGNVADMIIQVSVDMLSDYSAEAAEEVAKQFLWDFQQLKDLEIRDAHSGKAISIKDEFEGSSISVERNHLTNRVDAVHITLIVTVPEWNYNSGLVPPPPPPVRPRRNNETTGFTPQISSPSSFGWEPLTGTEAPNHGGSFEFLVCSVFVSGRPGWEGYIENLLLQGQEIEEEILRVLDDCEESEEEENPQSSDGDVDLCDAFDCFGREHVQDTLAELRAMAHPQMPKSEHNVVEEQEDKAPAAWLLWGILADGEQRWGVDRDMVFSDGLEGLVEPWERWDIAPMIVE